MINLLRARLQEITDRDHDWPPMIVALRSECPHSIREVHPTKSGRYNCFAYALGLYQSAAYLKIAKNSRPNIFANAAFVSHLISEGVLRPTDLAAPGQKIIVYFRDGAPKHAGVVNEQRVTSKWGYGQFFEHAMFEVPMTYGCESQCYSVESPFGIESAFFRYAEKRGSSS